MHREHSIAMLPSLAVTVCALVFLGCDETRSTTPSTVESTQSDAVAGADTMVMPVAGEIGGHDEPIAGRDSINGGVMASAPVAGTDNQQPSLGGTTGTLPVPGGQMVGAQGQVASLKANVRFKGVHRIKGDWSKALALPSEDLCRELGQHDCFDFVHTIALGGIDPYESQVYEASDSLAINAPLVVERIALAACGTRYDRDLAAENDTAVLFQNIELTSTGGIVDIESEGVRAYINRLYNRALLRMPTEQEHSTLKGFYETLTTIPGAESHARDWGVLTCFMVLTSTENLFY